MSRQRIFNADKINA